MATLDEMKKTLISDYQERYDKLFEIAFQLNQLNEPEIEMMVIRKIAGLKMLIDHCKGENKNGN